VSSSNPTREGGDSRSPSTSAAAFPTLRVGLEGGVQKIPCFCRKTPIKNGVFDKLLSDGDIADKACIFNNMKDERYLGKENATYSPE
jgi:hypothetical protein